MPQMRLVMKCASRGSLPFMKMLYPRKIDEVLWHSATCRLAKSILVKLPRLPTMRVIGSQFISTRFLPLVAASLVGAVIVLIESLLSVGLSVNVEEVLVGPRVVASSQFSPRMPPLRFLIYGGL